MTKIHETEILRTPVFSVVTKEFKETQFKPVGLNCNDWVMVIITDGENAIFVKQTRWGLEDKTIEFPCGTVDLNDLIMAVTNGSNKNFDDIWNSLSNENKQRYIEDSRMIAAIREVKEETGMVILDIKKLISFNPNPAYFNNTMTIYKAEVSNLKELFTRRGEQHLDKNEDCIVFLKPIKEMKDEVMKHAMGIVAICALNEYK